VLPGVNFFPISLIIGAVWSGVIASFAAKGNLFRAVIYMTIISLLTIGSGLVFQPEWRIAAESLGIAPAEVSSTVGYFDVVGTVVALAHKLIGG
jgi:galactitol-specific phosphotransferase system IIC component